MLMITGYLDPLNPDFRLLWKRGMPGFMTELSHGSDIGTPLIRAWLIVNIHYKGLCQSTVSTARVDYASSARWSGEAPYILGCINRYDLHPHLIAEAGISRRTPKECTLAGVLAKPYTAAHTRSQDLQPS